MKQDATGIVNKIAGSKKYNGIYIKTIEHIVKQCLERYDSREAEKKPETSCIRYGAHIIQISLIIAICWISSGATSVMIQISGMPF